MRGPAVRVVGLTKHRGPRTTVDRVSLEVAEAETLVICGPSGCGKTTLLRLIAGLEAPDAGEIWLFEERVSATDRVIVPPYRRRLGYVFQDLALWPHLTVRAQLDFVMASVGTPHAERDTRARDVLELVHVEALASRYPHELSGGEQQRAAIARALVARPVMLLMDEPLSSLDADLRLTLREELKALERALHTTLIYVTHDREEAVALADRIIQMRDGRIQAAEPTGRPNRA